MATFEQFIALLSEGKGMLSIMKELHVPPSRVHRFLNSRRMRRYIDLQFAACTKLTELHLALSASEAPFRLRHIAQYQICETGRRASRDLIEQFFRVLKTRDRLNNVRDEGFPRSRRLHSRALAEALGGLEPKGQTTEQPLAEPA